MAYETLPTPGSSSSATSRWVVSSRLEAAAPPSPGSPGWGPGPRESRRLEGWNSALGWSEKERLETRVLPTGLALKSGSMVILGPQ